MSEKQKDKSLNNLPHCAVEYINLVIKTMRYRRRVRNEVKAELAAHFEDALKDCRTEEEKEKKAQNLITEFGDAKLLAVLTRRAKKRCRPLWQKVIVKGLQSFGILIICLTVYIAWFLTGKPTITTDYIAEYNRLTRPVTDESLNAAPFYNKAMELTVEKPEEFTWSSIKIVKNLTSEEKQKIEKWVNSNQKALEQIVLGNKKPYYWATYSSDCAVLLAIELSHLRKFRNLAYAFCWRALLYADEGKFKDAFKDIISTYVFGQHTRGHRLLIEQLVTMAIERDALYTLRTILNTYKIDHNLLYEIQMKLDDIVAGEDFTVSTKTERFIMYDEIQRCFAGRRLGGLSDGALSPYGIRRLGVLEDDTYNLPPGHVSLPMPLHLLFTHPDKQESIKMVNDYYAFWDLMTRKTPAHIRAENIDVDKYAMQIIRGNILLEVLSPAFYRVIQLSYFNKADVEAALVVLAVLRYESEKGRFPDTLDELLKTGYLNHIPIDPYSDKPLIYKKTENNFILYSLGPNFVDDGGRMGKDREGKAKMWSDNGDAVFWPVAE